MTTIFSPPAAFETPRLVLRVPVEEDAEHLFAAYATDVEVTRYMVWRPHSRIEETRDWIARSRAEWAAGTGWPYVIELREAPGRPVGGLHLRRSGIAVSFGYVLARALWGRGLMPEAVRAVTDWAIAQPGIWRVWAVCDVDNVASARVLEKAGLSFEGIMRRAGIHPGVSTEPRDARLYARVR